MAQLLIFQRDNTHPDPVINEQGCYKTGDVIVVADDSHVFSSAEHQHPFKVVSVPGSKSQWEIARANDNAKLIPKAALKIPALRRTVLNHADLILIRRRRYKYTDKLESKDYA